MLIIDIILKNKQTEKDIEDKNGYNSVYYATYNGHLEVIKYLKSINVPYKKSNNGTTCLHVAVRRNFPHIVEFFLKKLTENDKEKFGYDHENRVIEWNKIRKWEQNIDVDEQKNEQGIAAIHLAIKENNLPILKILYKYGADFGLPNEQRLQNDIQLDL